MVHLSAIRPINSITSAFNRGSTSFINGSVGRAGIAGAAFITLSFR